MSEFHGGYLLTKAEGETQHRIVEAAKAYLDRHRVPRKELQLVFAAREGSPVTLVAVSGGPADGKGSCYWHREHAALGSELAIATKGVVWAYCYENQTGFEMVVRFDEHGRETDRQEGDWDRVAAELQIGESSEEHERLKTLLPLGRLASELGVPRGHLDMDLAYDTPSCAVPLSGTINPGTLREYLAGPLLPVRAAPQKDDDAVQALYFPDSMAREIEARATSLGVSMGTLVWAAWEAAKPGVYADTCNVSDDPASAPRMSPTPSDPPRELRLPAEAPVPAELPQARDKVRLDLALPPRVMGEIRDLAHFADRSMSWVAQSAYARSRARLLVAQRA